MTWLLCVKLLLQSSLCTYWPVISGCQACCNYSSRHEHNLHICCCADLGVSLSEGTAGVSLLLPRGFKVK